MTSRLRGPVAGALLLALAAVPAGAEDKGASGRNFDLRVTFESGGTPALAAAQSAAVERLRQTVPDLRVTTNPLTGAVRTVTNPTGFLTGPRSGDAEQIALDFVRENLDLFGLTEADLSDYEVTDRVYSRASGVTHLYLRQRLDGIPVYNGQLHANVAADGRILSVNNLFVPGLAAAINTTAAAITPAEAMAAVAFGLQRGSLPTSRDGARQMILPIHPGEARLVWNFNTDLGSSWYDVTVDAVDGRLWTRYDWVTDASYRAYETPVEHPGFAVPAPPADARTLAVNPQDATASPFGWHDTNGAGGAEFTTTQGNNVHSYTDVDANNVPDPGSSPDCTAALVCDFPMNLNNAPSTYRPAAVTNLFYWNNIIHDIEYQYGFDEVGGNFQENNYGNGALGSDYVQAEAQDGSGTCNANFGTPPDGQNPRMQMFLSAPGCWSGSPTRDGDLDNLVIVHEYGHGISNRLVGGPSNVGCLGNAEQPGEGTSDWWGLSLTALASQTGPTLRGVGTWLFGDLFPEGIRPFPYSTDNTINPDTYSVLPGRAIPHGVGATWAQSYWEVYWALVDAHGFDTDFYNFTGTAADAGNIRAKYYLIEGLKNAPCSPGFVDVRDGILEAAAAAPFNGVDTCTMWEAFAAFGLGFSADQGSSNSTSDQTQAFDLPPVCSLIGAPATGQVCAGSNFVAPITVGAAFTPPVTMSASGVPAPASAAFSPNPVPSVPNTTTLTISNTGGVAPGSYPITVQGSGGTVGSDQINLTVIANPGPPTLLTPINSTNTSTSPAFTWSPAGGATQYRFQLDDDPAFGSPVADEIVNGTSFNLPAPLPEDTLFFWRVSVTNCSNATSSVFRFVTAAPTSYCRTPNLAIPDSPAPGVNDNLVIADVGTIADLDVTLDVSHTWVGDLVFSLSNGTITRVFYDRPGRTTSGFGCSGDDIDVTVNDEGTDGNVESQCDNAPATSGNRIGGDPASSTIFSAFDGAALNDTWTLNASDLAGGDTGTVHEWCMQMPDSMPFLDGFETNNTTRWNLSIP